MSKRWLIKETATATETNLDFKGEVMVYFHGKGGAIGTNNKFMAKYSGYLKKASAAAALKRIAEDRYWLHELELIEMEIED